MLELLVSSRASFLLLVSTLFASTIYAQCNTDQNPYCAGNAQLEQLCCTYPSVCYWSNRNGDPACCPAGTDCRGDGGPALVVNSPSAVTQVQATTLVYVTSVAPATQVQVSTYYVTQSSTYWATWSTTAILTSLSTVTTPGAVIITTSAVVVTTAPPVNTNGAFVTVTQVQVISAAVKHIDSWRNMIKAVAAATVGILMLVA